jgi:nitrate reductase gamma subunit
MKDFVFHLLFEWYPYICATVFFLGSLIRFEREQYTWRASSSQVLRRRQLVWGSNLFHFGILFLVVGHFVGLLTPTAVYTLLIPVEVKQVIAAIAGGIAGIVCFVGLTLLLHRRLFDVRIRRTSSVMDIAILSLIWIQLVLGLITTPFSLAHTDGKTMIVLSHWAQGIVTLNPIDARELQQIEWPFLAHLVLGMTLFLLTPFSRLVHVFSAPVWYLGRRGYQVVRARRRPRAPGSPASGQPAE